MGHGRNILIIDDEKEFLNLLKDALDARGYFTEIAESAIEGGLLLYTKTPSLIVMDLKMPGIDGFQACEAIKRNPNTKNIPIIVVSALSDEASIKKAFKAAVDKYFVKPLVIEDLIKAIETLIGDDEPRKEIVHENRQI